MAINKKIGIVVDSLSNGGAEKVAADLSVILSKKGYEIYILSMTGNICYNYSGTLLNLETITASSNIIRKRLKYIVALRKILRSEKFDTVIDFRMRTNPVKEYLILRLYGSSKKIYTVHHYNLEYYFFSKGFRKFARFLYSRVNHIVVVSKGIRQHIAHELDLKSICIYNPIILDEIQKRVSANISFDYPYILGIGRMENNIKQFDQLIAAYKESDIFNQGIKLVLVGDGKQKPRLKELVKTLKMQDFVVFLPFQENPYELMHNARFLVLSSKNEGLPLVLLESMATQTPVISYDCPTGPSEIIEHKKNGLLVSNQNLDELAKAISRMVNDTDLYEYCKSNTLESVNRFSSDSIGAQWEKII